MALAKNKEGLHNLFEIVTLSYTKHLNNGLPYILKSELTKYRDNLLLGSSGAYSDVFYNALTGNDEELKESIIFYDYIEVHPVDCYPSFLSQNVKVNNSQIAKAIKRILFVGKECSKVVVATGDVRYLSQEDKIANNVLLASKEGSHFHKYDSIETMKQFRSTKEMINCFNFLSKEEAEEIVITNTNLIANQIEFFEPLPKTHLYLPTIKDSNINLKEICYRKVNEIYGNSIPEVIKDRLDAELNGIISNDYSSIVMTFYEIAKKANDNNYLFLTRGLEGSSLVLFLLGITRINPLKPYYFCKSCHYIEWIDNRKDSLDLDNKKCPICGNDLTTDGHNIPCEMYLGFNYDKVTNIDLDVEIDHRDDLQNYVKEIFGEEHVIRTGTVETLTEKNASKLVESYFKANACCLDTDSKGLEKKKIVSKIVGAKYATNMYPNALLVLPQDNNWNEFTSLQYPSNDFNSAWKISHFDFFDLRDTILKIDILGSLSLKRLRNLEKLTNVKIIDINLKNPELKTVLTKESKNISLLGIPRFDNQFMNDAIDICKPKTAYDLMRLLGMVHSIGTWDLYKKDFRNGKITFDSEILSVREEIMLYLMEKGFEKGTAYKIAEDVRKGKGLRSEYENKMIDHDVPKDYVKACKCTKYLSPKAYAVRCIKESLMFAYYKIHYPLEFYKDYLENCFTFSPELNATQPFFTKQKTHCSKESQKLYEIISELNKRELDIKKVKISKEFKGKFDIDYANKLLVPID